jgi:hypothetical protein
VPRTKRTPPKEMKQPCPRCDTRLAHTRTSSCAADARAAGAHARSLHPDRAAMAKAATAFLAAWAAAPRWVRDDVAGHYTTGSTLAAAGVVDRTPGRVA